MADEPGEVTKLYTGTALLSHGIHALGNEFVAAVMALVMQQYSRDEIPHGTLEYKGVTVAFKVNKSDRAENARIVQLALPDELPSRH